MLTNEQVKEAVEQMKVHCDLKMPNYEMVSARGVLHELGYGADVEQVLQAIYNEGFTYCFDPYFKSSNGLGDGGMEYPSADVCYWGPDQLKSRLQCVHLA